MKKPLNLLLAIALAATGIILSLVNALIYRFPNLSEDERITFGVTYALTACAAYYLFSFLLQGNVTAKKVLVILSSVGIALSMFGLIQNFSFGLQSGISVTVNILGVFFIGLLNSPSVKAWLYQTNRK